MSEDRKSKPDLLDRVRDKRRARKAKTAERAHSAARAKEPTPGEQRRDSGISNTGFGGSM